MENNIKIGDKVRLLHAGRHNSAIKEYNYKVTFEDDEIGSIIEILGIERDQYGHFGYQVMCNKGITYLRRNAFELVHNYKPEVNSLDSLVKLLKQAVIWTVLIGLNM